MHSSSLARLAALFALAPLTAACGDDGGEKHPCNLTGDSGCHDGHVCEMVAGGDPTCFAPVVIQGSVSDLASSAALSGARVVAADDNRAPASTVGISDSTGAYAIELGHVPRADATGKPAQASITLRGDMQGYQPFPSGIRTALPIDLSTAAQSSGKWVVTGPLTAVKLAALTNGGAAFIHGSIAASSSSTGGALVVAEPAPGNGGPQTGFTGVADTNGDYAIFNLQPNTQYVVTAYTQGANYTPITTSALASGDNAIADLALGTGAGATLAGGLIFNNGANESIQATLVVRSTFVPNLDRGETPPGLTVAGGASGYNFTGVPDGNYVVLAPFGLTGDVRDISGGGNTTAPTVTIAGGAVSGTPPSFKIIPAVDLLTIGGTSVGATPITVTSAPTFAWQKTSVDANASTFRVLVFDTFGNQIWTTDVDGATTSLAYGGPALAAGMTYLVRIVAIKDSMPVGNTFTQDSQTEDVPGVFIFQP